MRSGYEGEEEGNCQCTHSHEQSLAENGKAIVQSLPGHISDMTQ